MPSRIKRKRVAGWSLGEATTNPLGAVIVDRTSRFGNPFTIASAREMGYGDPRQAVIVAFTEWLGGDRDWWQSDEGDRRRERILADLPLWLRGRDVACPCEPGQPCHADELLRLAALSSTEFDKWATRVRRRVNSHRESRGECPLTPGTKRLLSPVSVPDQPPASPKES